MVIISSKKDGFRRAGQAHPAEATEYKDGHFTKEQLEQLHAEPMLLVQEVNETSKPESAPKPAPKMPEVPPTEDEIKAVFPDLPADGFKTDGVPKVAAVEMLLKKTVTADQVSAAWETHTTTITEGQE